MPVSALTKAAKLPQTQATWQATIRLAPAWIAPKGKPSYRPHLVFVFDPESGVIRQFMMEDQRPAPEAIMSMLANAMSNPTMGAGARQRPARIVVDDQALAQALTPGLAGIGVGCSYAASLPMVDMILHELSAHLNQGSVRPGLLEAPGVTLPLLAELYDAAAYFYRQAPWRWVDNLAAIEMRYPSDGPTCYAAIMGFGGQELGLAVFPTAEDLRLQYSNLEPDQLLGRMTALSISFGEEDVMAFDDLDAIARHGWPIVDDNAYPLVIKTSPAAEISLPSKTDLALLAAALRALPDFVTAHLRADRGAPQAAEATFALSGVYPGEPIAFRYPVALAELEALRQETAAEDAELEEMIADWHWDDASHAFARQVGAFLLGFLDYLAWTGLSEQTLRKHDRNCWLIGKFTCDYGGFKTFRPTIFLGGPPYLNEFRRKVSDSTHALNSYQATWRKLERYIRQQNYV